MGGANMGAGVGNKHQSKTGPDGLLLSSLEAA
jgi:hypothetical protein